MKFRLLLIISAALLLNAFFASAEMSCEIISSAQNCSLNGVEIIKLSDISIGGGHFDGAAGSFPYKVCCYGVPGLSVDMTGDGEFMVAGKLASDSHAFTNETVGAVNYYLQSETPITCAYATGNCAGFDTCLFSVSSEDNAHVAGCDANGFGKKFCCYSGAETCTIQGLAWGIVEGEEVQLPISEVGVRQLALMIIQGEGCDGASVDFTIKKGEVEHNNTIDDITFGAVPAYFGGTGEIELPGYALAMWWTSDPTSDPGSYIFYADVSPASGGTVRTPDSDAVTVNANCVAYDPWLLIDECEGFTENYLLENGCAKNTSGASDCNGIKRCFDSDCDGVDDCIDTFNFTAFEVDKCTGVTSGTSGCTPSMDCTNLQWSSCFECKAGQPCATAPFSFAGQQVMERCQGIPPKPEKCTCEWIGSKPEQCSDALLNQWDKRFKACITEEEFPVFGSWNFIAVLVLIAGYYGIIALRKRKK